MDKKFRKRIVDMFNKGNIDEDFVNIELSNNISKNILEYQRLHIMNLIAALRKSATAVVIDGSSTGTGKTYSTIAVCAHLGLQPYIICPKNVISVWHSVCKKFGVVPKTVVNYEMIRSCHELDSNNDSVQSDILSVSDKIYTWNFAKHKNVIVIFDEAHKCKNKNSLNGKLLYCLKDKAKIMLLSATLCDKPDDFIVFGYVLGFYTKYKKGSSWINGIIHEDKNVFDKKRSESALSKYIFPDHGSKMTMEDLGNKMPENIVSSECYTLPPKELAKLEKEYKIIKELFNKHGDNILSEIIKSRVKIEEYKIPIILDLAEKYIEMNKSVVIFINFINTMNIIKAHLDKQAVGYCVIEGGQDIIVRDKNIEEFQTNKKNIILVMMQCGSMSISLHDVTGAYPRVSLISLSFSSIELIQAIGRTYRSGLKSQTLQKIILCDTPYEKRICEIIREKNNFLEKLSDDDFVNF